MEIAVRIVRVFDLRKSLDPIEATADTIPEAIRILDGLGVHLLVNGSIDLRCGRKALRDWVLVFVHYFTCGAKG